MNLIDRYVYAVTKGLPYKQREDIAKEIRTLIDDMLEQHQEDVPYEEKVKRVLLGLGDPELLADSYRESKRYLIGPQNFESYFFILKIVLGAVFLGITIATVVGSFFEPQEGIIGIITSYLAILFSALMQSFAWVTAAFAIAEYKGVNLLDKKDIKEGWSIAELPQLPEKDAAISKVETVFAIIFSTIFISIILFAPQAFAAYISSSPGNTIVIPVFNIEVLSRFKILFVAIFILGILKEALKFYYGRWTLKLSIPVVILSVASAVLTISIFVNPDIWNANFALEVMKHFEINIGELNMWNSLKTGLIIVIILSTLIEIVTSLYKGIKYNQ
ncbi:MAG: hypothetical protein K0R80_347 [Clostridia bacterium]|jgi:hypothetical protein|nr:hypothetical protein [Clostridia bacterium]